MPSEKQNFSVSEQMTFWSELVVAGTTGELQDV